MYVTDLLQIWQRYKINFTLLLQSLYQNSKNCQIKLVEIDNFLNFELLVMFRQVANDIDYKRYSFIYLGVYLELVKGYFLLRNGFDKLLMTCLLKAELIIFYKNNFSHKVSKTKKKNAKHFFYFEPLRLCGKLYPAVLR